MIHIVQITMLGRLINFCSLVSVMSFSFELVKEGELLAYNIFFMTIELISVLDEYFPCVSARRFKDRVVFSLLDCPQNLLL